jgi:uncharacterized Ntn-hydrolase superfamily protein
MTFSIVAYSPEEEAWGVAVASKFLAAAAVVSWARAGAGAIATQAYARLSYGREGLDLLESGLSVEETLARLLATDPDAEHRQVGVVGPDGEVAAHTGTECFEYAGHVLGERFTCQGNILVGRGVLEAMADAYRDAEGSALAERLVAALQAGDRAGGDRRGRQSAGLLVVKEGGAYGGDGDRMIDLRVDDDPDPVERLGDLLALHHLYFDKSNPEARLPIDGPIAVELQDILCRTGHYDGPVNGQWDEATRAAFWALVGVENLEERWTPDDHPDRIDPVALDFLRKRYGK